MTNELTGKFFIGWNPENNYEYCMGRVLHARDDFLYMQEFRPDWTVNKNDKIYGMWNEDRVWAGRLRHDWQYVFTTRFDTMELLLKYVLEQKGHTLTLQPDHSQQEEEAPVSEGPF